MLWACAFNGCDSLAAGKAAIPLAVELVADGVTRTYLGAGADR